MNSSTCDFDSRSRRPARRAWGPVSDARDHPSLEASHELSKLKLWRQERETPLPILAWDLETLPRHLRPFILKPAGWIFKICDLNPRHGNPEGAEGPVHSPNKNNMGWRFSAEENVGKKGYMQKRQNIGWLALRWLAIVRRKDPSPDLPNQQCSKTPSVKAGHQATKGGGEGNSKNTSVCWIHLVGHGFVGFLFRGLRGVGSATVLRTPKKEHWNFGSPNSSWFRQGNRSTGLGFGWGVQVIVCQFGSRGWWLFGSHVWLNHRVKIDSNSISTQTQFRFNLDSILTQPENPTCPPSHFERVLWRSLAW